MPDGIIIKALSGFYYVKSGEQIVQCRARGIFRKRKISPLVGDSVSYEAENATDGYILQISPRKNFLDRPPIANIDQALLVFSVAEPDYDELLLDRFLVQMENRQILSMICLTKWDLLQPDKKSFFMKRVNLFRSIGYRTFITSSFDHEGLSELFQQLNGKISVVSGQSGVGKSSLLNALNSRLQIETQSISHSLGRGKHTTRHVELLPLGDGLIADTPGFSSLEFSNLTLERLEDCFPEFRKLRVSCRFRGCSHIAEPGCAVKEALESGEVDAQRYDHYCTFYREISEKKTIY